MSRYIDDDKRNKSDSESSATGEGLSRGSGEKRSIQATYTSSLTFGPNRRERIVIREREYRVRPSEEAALKDVGIFRIAREEDLVRAVYGGQEGLAEADLRSLRRQKLIESVSVREQDRTIRVHALTKTGHQVAGRRKDGGQKYHFGFGRPAELFHDSLLYKAFRHQSSMIRTEGGVVRRVILDLELKRIYFRRVSASPRPKNALSRAILQNHAAAQLNLPVVNGRVAFPDFRLEYEEVSGGLSRCDIEVATDNYRDRHLAAKRAAGFLILTSTQLKSNVFPREMGASLSL